MTELRDKSVLHEAQTHLEAYKRGEEFDNVDDLMADLMKDWNWFFIQVSLRKTLKYTIMATAIKAIILSYIYFTPKLGAK